MKPLAALVGLLSLAGCLVAPADALTVGTTTTTQDTGLLEVLFPAFERETGLIARAVVGGTGEIVEKGRHGDVDVLFTHSPARERALVADGTALRRDPVMFNRFVVVGALPDPAGVRDATTALDALRRIHDNRSTFFSRGDGSGTHDKEMAVWKSGGLDPAAFDHGWYKETGTGQGATLTAAAEFGAYMLVDEGTLLQFHEEGRATRLVVLHEGDPVLRNQYAVTQLDPTAIPVPIQSERAARFAAWLAGPAGQSVIRSFRIGGRPVFTANADDPTA
jgi:tungstate transport system substrate-binding protein